MGDIEWRNSLSGCSAFFRFAYQGKDKPLKGLAKYLRKAGALENALQEKAQFTKRTPLHCAALNGYTATVKELLSMGADKNAKDTYGKAPLDLAKSREFHEIVGLLS